MDCHVAHVHQSKSSPDFDLAGNLAFKELHGASDKLFQFSKIQPSDVQAHEERCKLELREVFHVCDVDTIKSGIQADVRFSRQEGELLDSNGPRSKQEIAAELFDLKLWLKERAGK
jgi:hypothetical protein